MDQRTKDITVELGFELGNITKTFVNNNCFTLHIEVPIGVRVNVVSSMDDNNLYVLVVKSGTKTKIKHDDDESESEPSDIKLCSKCFRNPCVCSSGKRNADADTTTLEQLKQALLKVHHDPVYFRNIVAQVVMKWKKAADDNVFYNGTILTHVKVPPVVTGRLSDLNLFTPDCKPEDDYEVLDVVRDSWTEDMQNKFRASLCIPDGIYYVVGDFSKAALSVLIMCSGK